MITTFDNKYDMYKNQKKMQVIEIEKGIVLPRRFLDDEPMWGCGGVCDATNSFVDLSKYDGGWAKYGGIYEWNEEEFIDEEVVYFGLFFKHWGHFLVDLLGRAWYLLQKNKKMKVVLIGEEEPEGNYLEFFELLGVDSNQLLRVKKPTRFKKVIVPEVACRPCIWYTEEFLNTFDYIAEKVMREIEESEKMEGLKKIYFSRVDFEKATRTEFGEKEIAKWMEVNNYKILCPEKMTLREQIFIWNYAEEIVCLNGSIPINIMFSKNKKLKLVVMNKTSLIHKNLDLFLLMRNCKAIFLDAYWEPLKNYPKSIGEGPFLLGISDDIVEYSKREKMKIPFDARSIKHMWYINLGKLLWCILDIKGKIRRILSRIIPNALKIRIRNMRKQKNYD